MAKHMIFGMTSLIQSIAKAKKNFLAPQRMNFEELTHFVQSLCAHFKFGSQSPGQTEATSAPSGVVVGIIPEVASLNHISEFLPRALLAGNAVILHASESAPWPTDLLNFVSQFSEENKFYQEDLIQIIATSNAEELEILTSHPAINGVYGAGSSDLYLNLMKNSTFQTKKHFWRGSSSNSFLVLAEANLHDAFECFWRSGTLENGLHPTSTKKLLLLESHLPEFKAWLSAKTESGFQSTNLQEAISKIKSEGGKVLLLGAPTIVLDLPHCSEFQQAEVNLPIAFVSTVKYPHEMVKWNNTSQYAMSAVVFGPEEKARSLAKKLDVGSVWINRSYDPKIDSLPIGNKQSHFGFKDLSTHGDFFSDRQSIN